MSDVEALQKEVQKAITELNDRLLIAEGELFAARKVISILANSLVIADVFDRDGWNGYVKKCAEYASAGAADAKDIPTRKHLNAAASSFRTFLIEDASPNGFRPVVIKGGKQPD